MHFVLGETIKWLFSEKVDETKDTALWKSIKSAFSFSFRNVLQWDIALETVRCVIMYSKSIKRQSVPFCIIKLLSNSNENKNR